ncbi:uncharacterized protein LOC120924224 isoform X2 [Rana temporaria]|uniref:uncharacterized protein LOC120924224 isoform X2 n=1 Tax=Rana temporaria TaxID=8407 RepID=UPI001AACDCFD|nr:uncharacterized protein LOC120924224 isoform X2 [Rana temporaria]
MQEIDLRHRKSDPGGRRDLEHKITEDVHIILHTTAEVTHSCEIKVTESTESKNIVAISHNVQSIVNQEQVNPPDPLELKNKVLIGCEINVSQYEEELTSRAENLEDNEPLGNSEHKVYKGGQHTGEPSSDGQYEESLFQPITLQSLSFEDQKQLVGTTGQEEEEQIKSLMEITTERGEYNITTEQEPQVLEESIDSTVALEFDVDNILDVIENNKKLVTPVDEPESSSSQGGDSRKTWEDLLETANRLAKHCDLFQKVEDQKGSDTLRDLDETLGSMPASILSTDLGYTEEYLTSVNVSLTKSNFLWEQSENKQTNLEEETIKTQSLGLGQSDRNLEEEGKEVSAKDVTKPTNKEDVQRIEEHLTEKQEEKHQFKGSERQPKISKKQKIKRRVHFSPSTEDLFKKSERASRNTLQMVCDEILEGELQQGEDREQLGSSYIIKDLGQSPSKEREGNYLGGTTCSYDSHNDGQSTSEEEETNGINEGPTNGINKSRAVWYDNYSAQAEHDKRCDSLGAVTDQHVHVDSKMEESFTTATDSRSTEEHLDHSEETLSVETESSGNRDMSNINNEQTELFTENKNESHALRETVTDSENESRAASDGAEETVRKEDSFLEEGKRQVEYLLEERKDLLECDPTHVKEFIDDIRQSSDTLETKNVGLSKDFTDEQKKTDNLFPEKAILGQDYPTEDTQLENIIHYSAHRDITETASAENELTLGQCSILETDKIIKSEEDGKEVQDETILSDAKDVLKSFEEQTRSSIVQFDDTLLREPVSRNGDDEYPEKLHETQLSTKVTESTESKNTVAISHNVQSIVSQEQVNPPDPLELKNKILIGCKINISQYEEEFTSRAENLEDNEPLGNSEHKVYKGGQHTGEPSSDGQYEESLFQPITLQSLSFEDQKQLVGTTGQEEEEQIKSLISRNGDDEYPEKLHETQLSTSVDEICISLAGDVELRDGPPSEEHKEVFRDAHFEGESEHNNETSTNEMEEQPENMTEKQSYDYKHEGFPPETSKPQEEESNVKTGHIEVELLTEQQWVAEEPYGSGNEASLTEGHFTEQMQDGNSFRQLAPTDGSEECPEESYEPDQSASLNEVRTSIVQDVLIREGLVPEECSEIYKDSNFKAQSESHNKTTTYEIQEHTTVQQNDDYTHEDFQLDDRESQEEDDRKVKNSHTEVEILNDEQLVDEGNSMVLNKDSLIAISCNDQLQEDRLQGQPVFRDSDEVCHEELVAIEQNTSVVVMCTSIVEEILKKEDQVSEEFNDFFKDVNHTTESESIKEIMTHEVQEHTSIIQNDDYIHEHFQPNAGESKEDDIQVGVGHIEEDISSEEQLVVHKEDSLIEVSCNDQLQEGKLQGQPVFRDSDEVWYKELVETEQGTSVIEMHTSIVEHIPKGEDQVSEEFNDNLKDVSFKAESESIKEILTHGVEEHTSNIQNDDYIHERSQPNAGESQEEDIQVRVGHIEEDIFSEEQLVVHKEDSLIEVSCNDQLQEGKLQGQPVFRDSDEVWYKELVETEQGTSVIEMHTSIVEHIPKGEDHVSEEFNDNLKDVSFRAESESIKEIMTLEVQEHTSIIQNDDYIHEHSQPNAGESQEEDIQVGVGHIEEDIFSEEQLVVHKEDSLIEVSCNDQLQEGRLQGQPVFRDSDEVWYKELVETEQGTSVIEMHASIVEHIPKGEDQVTKESNDILKDVSFRAESESIKELMTHEVQKHTSIIQNDDYIHERSQPNAGESQEEDIQVRVGHIEEDIFSEEQLVVHKEDSLIEVSSNDQLQEGKLQGQPVFRDIDEVCRKESLETEQSTSVIEMCTSIVEDILKREGQASEEFNVNFRAESESLKEMMTYEVQEHTSIIENDGYVHEHFQPDATGSQEEDTQVRTDHTEVEFLTEEQFVLKYKMCSAEGTRNDQHYEDRSTSQPVPGESNEVSPKKLHETELSKLTGEICTSIAEGVLIENSFVSEEERDVFREVSLITEEEPHSETSTCEQEELQQYTDKEQNHNCIYEDSSIKTRKSQEDDGEVSSGHLEVLHLTKEQLVAEGQFKVDNDASAKDHLQEDRLLKKTVFRDSNEVSPEKQHETEPRTTANDIGASIVNDVLRDSLVSEESRESFSEAGLKEESISHGDTSTGEVKELQDHTAEEQNNDYINEVSKIETRKSQEDDSEGNTDHLDAEHVTEEPFVTEEQFKVDNEASPIEGSSTGDQLQEDRLLGQSDSRGSDELCHKELFETVQSTSLIETLTSVVEDVLITEGLMSEQCSQVIKDADFKTESISLNETTTYEIQEQRSEKQNKDYTHEESQLDARESQEEVSRVKIDHIEEEQLVAEQQLVITNDGSTTKGSQEEDSKVKIGHIEVEFLSEEQLVAEEPLLVHNEDSLTEVSGNDQLQEDRLQEQPISRYIDDVRHQELYETEQNTSMVEMCPLIVEDGLIKEDLVSEEFSGVSKDVNLKSESESHNESITCEVQDHMAVKQNSDYTNIDLQQDVSELQGEDSKEKIGHVDIEFLTVEQSVVTDIPCPEEGSSNDQLKEELLREPVFRDSDNLRPKELYEKELSALENEIRTSFSEDAQISDVIGSEDHTEVLTEAGLLQESKSYRATSMCEVEEQQEHTPGENNDDHIFEVSLTETSKSQGHDNEVNTVCLEAENITKEQLVSETQFEVPNEASQIEGSSTDQLQEDGLLQTISKESDEINNKELDGTEQSASVIKLCISIADDILRDSLGSEELSGIIKETHFKAASESHNETTTCEIQEQSGESKDNDYTHEDSQPETNESQEEDGKFKASHTEVVFLTEEQFVVTVDAYQVEKSSNDQMQEGKLSEEHTEVSLKTENKSDSEMSTCEVEDLQEHTTEEHNDNYLCEDFQIETSKSQEEEDSKAKIAPTEVEFVPKEQFVFEEEFVLKNAFLTDEDRDLTEEKHDFSNDTNKAFIKVIEKNEPQLEQDNKKLLKESYEDEGFSHQATNAVAQNTSTGQTLVLDTTAEQENQFDKIFQSPEKELDLLSDINSTIYSSLLDQSISVSSEGTGATLDTQKMESELYASHITASNLDSVLEVAELADFEVENVSKSPKELDLLSEIQCMLSPDHTVLRFPELVDDLNGKVAVSSEGQSSAYAEEQASEISKDLGSSSGSLLEDPTDNWRSTSESNDLLLEIQSVITADRDIKTENFSSSVKLVESDVRVEEEDEKASHLTSGNSVYETEEYVRLETSTVEEEVDNEQKVISIENLGLTVEPSQVEDDVSQHDSLFGTVVINTSVLEEAVNVDIINTSTDGDIFLTRELCGPEIDSKSLTQTGLIKVDINKVQSSTDEETTTIYLNEVDYENREHGIEEEYPPTRQTSCHADITRGQEKTLVDETGMSNEPVVQEEDDLDTKVPFHSFLDVSAQKSRILLLRKTSVRRRPGQRPVMFQEELADPSAIPPLNMEVTPDPESSSYPTEEATEMSDTSGPLLHRKSSIRRRGQRPASFQEELAPPPLNMGMPPAPESSYPTEEATETRNASEPLLRRKSTIRRRGPRPVTFEGEPSLPLITSAESPHPTEEPRNESTISEQILHGKSSIHQGQHPVAFEDEPVEASPPVIMPQKMQVPHFSGGIPILSPAVAPRPEFLHPAEEPRDEGTTSEPMLRRKSSVRRSKGKQPVTSEEQHIEPPLPVTAPLRMGVALFPGVPAHVTPAPAPSHPKEESREEKTASEELIKPKKGFLKHAGFGGAHPGMMQELQARLHKKKPKE